eukprot:9829111-Alexandrium_andersonii.AAC.1
MHSSAVLPKGTACCVRARGAPIAMCVSCVCLFHILAKLSWPDAGSIRKATSTAGAACRQLSRS